MSGATGTSYLRESGEFCFATAGVIGCIRQCVEAVVMLIHGAHLGGVDYTLRSGSELNTCDRNRSKTIAHARAMTIY